MSTHGSLFEDTVIDFADTIAAAIPDIMTALLFLLLAYVAVKTVLAGARSTLRRLYTGNSN